MKKIISQTKTTYASFATRKKPTRYVCETGELQTTLRSSIIHLPKELNSGPQFYTQYVAKLTKKLTATLSVVGQFIATHCSNEVGHNWEALTKRLAATKDRVILERGPPNADTAGTGIADTNTADTNTADADTAGADTADACMANACTADGCTADGCTADTCTADARTAARCSYSCWQ
ncbi:hypothetical protein BDZ91DRAFT_710386 [Kalaharituber pfeilii]|nr:hypothetical protein BDZ91DRAFT_710386 [Kalaharituber pfeilii]